MKTETLYYKLTGTETPKRLTEREKVMIIKFQSIMAEEQDTMLKVLKAIANYADSVNSASDLYNSPLVADVKAVIKEVEQK